MKLHRNKNFPPAPPWTMDHALAEVQQAARWARGMGYQNIASHLEWAAKIIEAEQPQSVTAKEG